MEKGVELNKELIDGLVKISGSCVNAAKVEGGLVKGTAEDAGINQILGKLSEEERKVLAQYISKTYQSGIYDMLVQLEWLRECRGMKISMEGEELPLGQFEGIPCDYIGRCGDWEWPEV